MIGIAIINYKSYEKTIECIESIRKTTKTKYKVYLLENGSGNNSAEKLKKEYIHAEDVELIISEENHGYARGNNICIRKMRDDGCQYGIITNNDILCKENSIDKLIYDLEKNKDYVIIGPKITDPAGNYQPSVKLKLYKGIEYIIKSTYFSNFFKKAIQREKKKLERISGFREVSWVSGAFFGFSLENMKIMGDFDPTTFLFFEEYILGEKARRSRLKIGYDPSVSVIHFHAISTGGGANIISKIAADRSERYYFQKYAKKNRAFFQILKVIRSMEVIYTFGKKKEYEKIRKYFLEVKVPLK